MEAFIYLAFIYFMLLFAWNSFKWLVVNYIIMVKAGKEGINAFFGLIGTIPEIIILSGKALYLCVVAFVTVIEEGYKFFGGKR